MSDIVDGVESVQEADSGDRAESEAQVAEQSAANTETEQGHLDSSEQGAAGQPALDAVTALAGSLDGLAEQLRAHHDRAQARERVIDQLHAEVERLRVGEQGLLLRPIVVDLQRLRSDILHQAATLSAQMDQPQAAALLESFALSVELTLERCGSVPIRPSVGAQFSAREHRAVKLVPAANPAEDGTIAAVVADGYLDTSTERITAPARVHVQRWTPPEEPSETSAAADANRSEQQESKADV